MFNENRDFYPTPQRVFDIMIQSENLAGKVIYDPSCGSGNILEFAMEAGALEVLGTEIDSKLRKISAPKCRMIGTDFLSVTTEQISHVDMIIMNPPFSADESHILHAIEIAPANCRIISLCNYVIIKYDKTKKQQRLTTELKNLNADISNLESAFSYSDTERKTWCDIGLIKLTKRGTGETEFDGFFMEEEPEELQHNGIVKHNFVRDTVNRYVAAVRKFEEVVKAGSEIQSLCGAFFNGSFGFSCNHYENKVDTTLNKDSFKKELQKQAWQYVFKKLNMDEYVTRKLREDLNKFVEKQKQYPFTMKNVYQMIKIVILTHDSRMDTALLECFDKVTMHSNDNKYGVEGWKTNDVYLLSRKFILPNMCAADRWTTGNKIDNAYGSYFDFIEDFCKALCYITKRNYNKIGSLSTHLREEYLAYDGDEFIDGANRLNDYELEDNLNKFKERTGRDATIKRQEKVYGVWIDWGFFKVKAFKKGTCHFEFKDENVWALFNSHIARIKGFALPASQKRGAKKEKEYAKNQKKVNEQMGDFSIKKKRDSFSPEPASNNESESIVEDIKTEFTTKSEEDMKIKKIENLDAQEAIAKFEEEGIRLSEERELARKEIDKAAEVLTEEPVNKEGFFIPVPNAKEVIEKMKEESKVKEPIPFNQMVFNF